MRLPPVSCCFRKRVPAFAPSKVPHSASLVPAATDFLASILGPLPFFSSFLSSFASLSSIPVKCRQSRTLEDHTVFLQPDRPQQSMPMLRPLILDVRWYEKDTHATTLMVFIYFKHSKYGMVDITLTRSLSEPCTTLLFPSWKPVSA